MKTKNHFWIWIILLLFSCLTQQVSAQPYYYFHGADVTESPHELWRFNFQTNTKELFFSDSVYYGAAIVSWDPTQQWIFLTQDNSQYPHEDYYISTGVVNAGSRNIVHVLPDQHTHPPGTGPHSFDDHFEDDKIVYDGIVYNPVKNVFYVTWFLPYPDTIASYLGNYAYQRTVIYDATTFTALDTLTVPPGWITAQASVSEDGNFLYLIKYQGAYPVAVGKYSLATKQLIINRNLSDIIVPGIRKSLDDSKKGKYLVAYCYPQSEFSDGKYALYNIDLDTSVIIPIPQIVNGSISSDGRYIIIEETPFKPNHLALHVPRDELFDHPGRISVFNGVTGQLIQKLTLPPEGKVLVFDNYPNMLYYYLPGEQRSINIDLSKLAPPTGYNVKLVNNAGTKLTSGALQYYDSAWKDAVNNNDGTFSITTSLKTLSLRMTYEYGIQTKSNVPISTDTIVFQTVNTQVQLQNSSGTLMDTGSVQYYAGAWRTFGTTINGVAAKELLPVSYSFRMTYAYASNDKQQDISTNAAVVFQTVNAAVQLKNSQGNLIDQGTVQYYSGAWRDLGTTTNGIATKELLPNSYSFRMYYAFASKDKQQDISTNPTIVFQTVNAVVQLQNSQGTLMDQGTVQYYSGAWRDLGITSNGVATKELLPNSYSFRMNYAFTSKDKQQDISANPTVVFQTVNAAVQLQNSSGVLMDTGAVQYYSGAWRVLGTTTNGIANKELLPNSYSFRITYSYVSLDKTQDLSSNATVSFSTVLCTMRVKNSQSQLIDNALASYYSGAWRQIGSTVSGVITKELLPVSLSFRVKYGTQQIDKTQNLSTNNVVEFAVQ